MKFLYPKFTPQRKNYTILTHTSFNKINGPDLRENILNNLIWFDLENHTLLNILTKLNTKLTTKDLRQVYVVYLWFFSLMLD